MEAGSVEQLRKILATIQKHLGGMTTSQKLGIASLGVIVVMALLLVGQYAGHTDLVALLPPTAKPEEQRKALATLQAVGLPARERLGAVYVPAERQMAALGQLGMSGKLP